MGRDFRIGLNAGFVRFVNRVRLILARLDCLVARGDKMLRNPRDNLIVIVEIDSGLVGDEARSLLLDNIFWRVFSLMNALSVSNKYMCKTWDTEPYLLSALCGSRRRRIVRALGDELFARRVSTRALGAFNGSRHRQG